MAAFVGALVKVLERLPGSVTGGQSVKLDAHGLDHPEQVGRNVVFSLAEVLVVYLEPVYFIDHAESDILQNSESQMLQFLIIEGQYVSLELALVELLQNLDGLFLAENFLISGRFGSISGN